MGISAYWNSRMCLFISRDKGDFFMNPAAIAALKEMLKEFEYDNATEGHCRMFARARDAVLAQIDGADINGELLAALKRLFRAIGTVAEQKNWHPDLCAAYNACFDIIANAENAAKETPEGLGGAAQQDPVLIEVLNFIELCRSLKITMGGGQTVDRAIEREQLCEKADALYKKLEAMKWGVKPAPVKSGDAPQSPARVNRELLDKIIELSHSHVDGRFLFEPLLHRKQLDIKKRLDGVETWYEGDWLSDLGRVIKDAAEQLERSKT